MRTTLLFFLLILFSRSSLQSLESRNKPYVTSHLVGQLGNQLFEISAALALAWDNDSIAVFPELKRKDLNIPLNYKKIFFRLNTSSLPRKPTQWFNQIAPFVYVDIPFHKDVKLTGLFQSYRYFDHHREKILEIFSPSEEELSFLNERHADLLLHPYTVAIHVRTFNPNVHKGMIPFVGMDYYEQALSLFPPEALFVVFSDRINWCKHHFSSFNRPMVFIEGQDHVDDLFLMSMMKHQIIGNSSFSWWGAYLNKNLEKIVVAPDLFILPEIVTKWGAEPNQNLPEWIVIPIDLSAPYPSDVRDFDQRSASLDTQ